MFCWNSGLLKAPNVHFHFSVTFCLCFKKSLRAKPFFPFSLQIHFHADQTRFHVKRFLQRLVLKQRLMVTRKWPIKGLRILFYISNCEPENEMAASSCSSWWNNVQTLVKSTECSTSSETFIGNYFILESSQEVLSSWRTKDQRRN